MDYSLWDTFPFPAAPEKILFIIAFAINLFHYIQHSHTTVLSANHKAVKVATLGLPAETTGKESITLLMINFVVHQVGKQTMNKTSDKKHGHVQDSRQTNNTAPPILRSFILLFQACTAAIYSQETGAGDVTICFQQNRAIYHSQ